MEKYFLQVMLTKTNFYNEKDSRTFHVFLQQKEFILTANRFLRGFFISCQKYIGLDILARAYRN